jgi:hypothetical protein
LTGKGRDSTIIEAFRGGMSDYLSKHDLTRDELLRGCGTPFIERRKSGFNGMK